MAPPSDNLYSRLVKSICSSVAVLHLSSFLYPSKLIDRVWYRSPSLDIYSTVVDSGLDGMPCTVLYRHFGSTRLEISCERDCFLLSVQPSPALRIRRCVRSSWALSAIVVKVYTPTNYIQFIYLDVIMLNLFSS